MSNRIGRNRIGDKEPQDLKQEGRAQGTTFRRMT